MKVLLVANFALDRQESMLRFASSLESGLRGQGFETRVLAPSPWLSRLVRPYRYAGLPKYLGYFDKYLGFPRQLRRAVRREHPDIVHILDQGNAMYARASVNVPTLVTCHDLLQIRIARGEIPGQGISGLGWRFQNWILSHLSKAPHVACISQATRHDLLRLTGLPADRARIVTNSLHTPFVRMSPVEARRSLKLLEGAASFRPSETSPVGQGVSASRPGPHASPKGTPLPPRTSGSPWHSPPWSEGGPGFYLHVGGDQWYKNRPGLLRIYAALRPLFTTPPLLVMVGKPLGEAEHALIRDLNLASAVVFLTEVSHAQLTALYSLADGLIFPSLAEGFGWPIAEAQACGCPVFTTGQAPMTEVGGDAAVYFDPAKPEEAAAIVFNARTEKARAGERALAYARRWEPTVMFAAYADLYRQLIAARP